MTLRSFLRMYSEFRDGLLDKEIQIECPNGLMVTPTIKFNKKFTFGPNTDENINSLVITWEN